MNAPNTEVMTEATRLTRAGRLEEAKALLLRAHTRVPERVCREVRLKGGGWSARCRCCRQHATAGSVPAPRTAERTARGIFGPERIPASHWPSWPWTPETISPATSAYPWSGTASRSRSGVGARAPSSRSVGRSFGWKTVSGCHKRMEEAGRERRTACRNGVVSPRVSSVVQRTYVMSAYCDTVGR